MKSIFITIFSIFLVFNMFYISMYPEITNTMTIGLVTGLIIEVIAVAIIGGINIFGSGLSSESVKILFGSATLLNILFQINIPTVGVIGLGLASNILDLFSVGDVLNIGFYIVSGLSLIAFVSGLMVVME